MNFLSDYHTYSSGNEAPDIFHTWAAFSVLSACCGPNLWKDMGSIGNVQPNLYTMFVGPPGIKKSTAKDIAKRLISKIHSTTHPLPIAPASCSKEAFVQFLAGTKDAKGVLTPSPCTMVYSWNGKPRKYSKAMILSDEFVNLVNVGGDPMAWIQLLTEIYNPQPSFDAATISRGSVALPYPYITLLGCMTTDLTKALINDGSLSGGFSRRTIYIFANRNSKPVPEPVITPEQAQAEERLVKRGRQIQSLCGRFDFTPAGREFYNGWYANNFSSMEAALSSAVTNFLQSKPSLAIKIAMLAHLSRSDTLEIEEDDIALAVSLLDAAQMHIDTIFSGAGRNPHAATMAGIRQFIEAHCSRPPFVLHKKKVHGYFHNQASIADIDKMLNEMHQTEQIILCQATVAGAIIPCVGTKESVERYKATQTKMG